MPVFIPVDVHFKKAGSRQRPSCQPRRSCRRWCRLLGGTFPCQEAVMRAIGALLTILMLAPLAASAKTITVRGEGFASCAIWLREHAARSGRGPVQDSWVLGYVNAAAGMLDIPG